MFYSPLQKNFLLVIPVYNENNAKLQKLINDSKRFAPNILVIDDKSRSKVRLVGCRIFRNRSNFGKGYSIRRGCYYAIQNKFDFVIFMDGDGEHSPKDLPRFIDELNDKRHALIIGRRKNDRSKARSLLNIFGRLWLFFLTNKSLDFSCGFRAADTASLKKLEFTSNGFEIDIEMLLEAYKKGIKVKSIPIEVNYNNKSSLSIKDYIRINNFFDRWVIENINFLNFSPIKKTMILAAAHAGLLIWGKSK